MATLIGLHQGAHKEYAQSASCWEICGADHMCCMGSCDDCCVCQEAHSELIGCVPASDEVFQVPRRVLPDPNHGVIRPRDEQTA